MQDQFLRLLDLLALRDQKRRGVLFNKGRRTVTFYHIA
uniref:Uncharacterized protein n=1 Tax=Sinorhizobium meliloti (strain SM11) TaxID=707241 RepID=A4KVE7_SINMM|nr:hypothetical protein [Sinorhizobium meliloti SM11]